MKRYEGLRGENMQMHIFKCFLNQYLPHSTDAACGQSSGSDGGSLLHEAANRKPQAVAKRVLIDQQVTASFYAGVRVVPLIRCQSGENKTFRVRQERESQQG